MLDGLGGKASNRSSWAAGVPSARMSAGSWTSSRCRRRLDALLDFFGAEHVAEMTGRSHRLRGADERLPSGEPSRSGRGARQPQPHRARALPARRRLGLGLGLGLGCD